MVTCSNKRKSVCKRSPNCKWVVGKGCRKSRSKSPARRRRSSSKGCSRRRKSVCKPPNCKWVVGKGCRKSRSKSPVRRRNKSKSRSPVPQRGCSRLRKRDCKGPECKWVVGKGCRKNTQRSPSRRDIRSPLRSPIPSMPSPAVSLGSEQEEKKMNLFTPDTLPYIVKKEGEPYNEDWLTEYKYNEQLLSELDCIKQSSIDYRPVQRLAIDYFTSNDTSLLLAFDTGIGKTITALTIAQCYLNKNPNGKVIVVSPKSVIGNFPKEWEKYIGPLNLPFPEDKYHIYTYDRFYNLLKSRRNRNLCKNSLVILDEVHNLRNPKSKKLQKILKCTDQADRKLFLTATPFVNNMQDIYTLIKLLHDSDIPIDEDRWYEYLKGKVIFFSKDDDPNFPKKQEHFVGIKMTPEFQEAYMIAISDEGNIFADPKMFYNGHRRAVNTLKDEYSQFKMNEIMKIIQQDPSKQSIIYTNWIEFGVNLVIDRLQKEGVSYGVISGQTPDWQRKQMVQLFNNKSIKVLVITSAASEGIDLKEVENVFILDPTWNPASIDQIIGRAIRYKSHENLPASRQVVNVYYMVFTEHDKEIDLTNLDDSDSGDAVLYYIIFNKQKIINYINNSLKYLTSLVQ